MLAHTFATRVIHKPTYTDRRERLERDLVDFKDVQFITAEDIDPLLPMYLYCGGSERSWNRKFATLMPDAKYRVLQTGEINNLASHYAALASFADSWCLVLEDDALLPVNFYEEVQKTLLHLPENTDVIYLGGGFPHSLVLKPISLHGNFLRCEHPCTNTSCAYLISRMAALRALPRFHSFDAPIDLEFAHIQLALNLKVYHLYPYLVSEGSKSVYASSFIR
jgi:GR25 family glycosyltransferase involved in LPS biosynthesis